MGGSISLRFKVYGIKAGGYGTVYTLLDEETLASYCLKTARDRSCDKRHTAERALHEVEIWIELGKTYCSDLCHSLPPLGYMG
jgi:hypothetical protein